MPDPPAGHHAVLDAGLLDMVLRRRPHLVEATVLRMLLEKNLSFMRVEQAALPLHVVATDVLSGNEIVISSGPVVDAVLASAAIPGGVHPYESTVPTKHNADFLKRESGWMTSISNAPDAATAATICAWR